MARPDSERETALIQYVDAGSANRDFIRDSVREATALVASLTRGAEVPVEIIERAILEVGAELYHRRQAPNGIKMFADMDGTSTIRVARDPLVAARPLLAPYLKVAFA